MTPAEVEAPGAGTLRDGDPLVLARCGAFRLLVPLASVERVHPAALPVALPAAAAPAHPLVSVGGTLLPVLFGEALLGAGEARLLPGDQLLQLKDGSRQALLWVSAVEEVLAFQPLAPPPGPCPDLVAGFSGTDGPLAVLDVARALAQALGHQEAP